MLINIYNLRIIGSEQQLFMFVLVLSSHATRKYKFGESSDKFVLLSFAEGIQFYLTQFIY